MPISNAVQAELLASWPEALRPRLQRRLERVLPALQNDAELVLLLRHQDFPFWQQFARLITASRYALEQLERSPQLMTRLIGAQQLWRPQTATELQQQLVTLLQPVQSEAELATALRQFRQQQMLRLIWRDQNRLCDLDALTRELSLLADCCVDQALGWLYERQCQELGTPIGAESGTPQQLVVLGMGKLGAFELNLSSDIDLIFTYPEQGQTAGGRRQLDNQSFFIRLGQKLIRALDQQTEDGFVFRVDMRLRPYGQSGALVLSFNAMEQYYQDQGRDWERYAMIKARAIAGDLDAGQNLLARLKPFVFRRYIDFGAIEALREMKALLQREVRRKGLSENIKQGSGGIREVEFIGQAFQLIHGGRDKALQQRGIRTVLGVLRDQGYLPPRAVAELDGAYEFLRNVEHALQGAEDRQTQSLPVDAEEQTVLAWGQGFSSWEDFTQTLLRHRQAVAYHFSQVVADPEAQDAVESRVDECWSLFWSGALEAEEGQALLSEQGYRDPERAWQLLSGLREGRVMRTVRRQSLERINRFMPQLLTQLARLEVPDTALERLLALVEAVQRRTAYLVLLLENPVALEHLVELCDASPWIAEQIAAQPMLLDEFLNLGTLYAPPQKAALADELQQQLARIPEEDLEQQMETLRYFKLSHVLRVAAAEIRGTLELMKVSDYLTWIAEVVLEAVVAIAWGQLVARHGRPQRADGQCCERDFLVLAYGKLGGIELGPGSDLDLVFVHGAQSSKVTDGAKPIDSGLFYTRLGQRIVHILSTQTASGQLYEVDMRLRPSGNSGLLVSSMEAFDRYQREAAWTWEHQALVRARVVVGESALAEQFEATRRAVLGLARPGEVVREEVLAMRQKMREHLGSKLPDGGADEGCWTAEHDFQLKQDAGGIVDIEFMVQYAVLTWSHDYPELLRYTDNIRILEQLEQAGLLAVEDAELLREAYKAYRATAHRLSLQNQALRVSGDQFHAYRRGVLSVWNRLFRI